VSNIRNFCIIAHIDHGKSTLADRLLEITGTLDKRQMKEQVLDSMELEREKGITIKMTPVRMVWKPNYTEIRNPKSEIRNNPQIQNSKIFNFDFYILNLIDTPGHVDFSYEVSRSLAAVEGALLVVDATQGIQAQTLAHAYQALAHNLTLIPILNKIDLPAADVERCSKELVDIFGIKKEEIIPVSAKEGTNVEKILEAIVVRIPPPMPQEHTATVKEVLHRHGEETTENQTETKALIFDSIYDIYRGVLVCARVFSGEIKKGERLYLLNTQSEFEVQEVGYFRPTYVPTEVLRAGEIGYIVTGFKNVREAQVGDTLWQNARHQTPLLAHPQPLQGYQKVKPFVFAGIFSTENDDFPELKEALDKLSLNDASLTYEPENSPALGHGFRCGFLGLLHLEIVKERLEREYGLSLIITAPSVTYKIVSRNGTEIFITNPAELPDSSNLQEIHEPFMQTEVLTPVEFLGNVMQLAQEKRGIYRATKYLEGQRAILEYEFPLAELVTDFYDKLKSVSQGYASLNYDFLDYRQGDLVKLEILVAGETIDAFAQIVYRPWAYRLGAEICKKLKELIPQAWFVISLQAVSGGKIIARESISALKKDVTGHLYGGDISRKKKLWKKQQQGKKRMKKFGKVEIPGGVFLEMLKRG